MQSNNGRSDLLERILTLPPTAKSVGGAPVSDPAFLVRARAKAPGEAGAPVAVSRYAGLVVQA